MPTSPRPSCATRDEAEQEVVCVERVDELGDRAGTPFAAIGGDRVSTTKSAEVAQIVHLRTGRSDDHSTHDSRSENLARRPCHGPRRFAHRDDMNGIGARDGPGMLFERVRDQTGGIHCRDRCVETRSCVLTKPTADGVTRFFQPSALPHELDRPMSVIQ